jgi:hypothetical protein
MATERQSNSVAPILLAAAFLMWPVLWKGYPLVFFATGRHLADKRDGAAIVRHV